MTRTRVFSQRLRASRRRRVLALSVGLGLLVAAGSVGGSAGATSDLRTQRAAIRAEQARLAAQVDVMEGEKSEVLTALAALDRDVRTQQAILADARQQAEANAAEADRAGREAAATTAEIERLRERLARYAVQSYVAPPSDELLQRFAAASAQEDATRQALLSIKGRSDADLVDQLRAARGRLAEQVARAQRAKAEAERHIAESSAALERLETAQARQRTMAEQVRARLDERLADAAYLSRLDASFGAQIAAEEAALARAVAPIPSTPGSATPPNTARPSLTTVGGITVATSIADDTRALLAAAAAAGHRLGGYGYRDINIQIQLRRQNCGTSDYAVWQMPADSCSPPTARPGYSMHERGLAIDFTANGKFLNSRSTPAFVWLAANAGRFGFTNLPSEPWHWSHPG